MLGGNVSHGQPSSISQEHEVTAVIIDDWEDLKAPSEECHNCNEAVKRLPFESEKHLRLRTCLMKSGSLYATKAVVRRWPPPDY